MDDAMKGSNLQKYMQKNGFTRIQIDNVFKKAGEKRMSSKLKLENDSGDELPMGKGEIAAATDEDDKYGEMTKVDDDGGSDVEGAPSEFQSAGKKKKPYLD